MKTQPYTCPAGHECTEDAYGIPTCETCNLTATHIDGANRVVLQWTDIDDHEEARRDLQDQLDAAFDNQYFGGGW